MGEKKRSDSKSKDEKDNLKIIMQGSHKRNNLLKDEHFLGKNRWRIETTFSEITALMPRSLQARTSKGFLLKIMFFILGYSVKRLMKAS